MCGKPPDAPQLPAFPNLTSQENQILGQQQGAVSQQGNIVSGVGNQLSQNQQILQMISGLFNPDGTINKDALSNLQQSSGQSNQTAGAQGQSALSSLGGVTGALGATSQAYTQALQGNAPANKQLQYQQQQSFLAMQEQAAQQGIKITGTDFSNAVSESTAGQKLIQDFQQNANIQNQNYQLGYLGQLGGNMAQLAGAGATQANTGLGLSQYSQQNPLGYVGQSISGGQGALSPYLQNYQTGLQNLYQPYQMQQLGPYSQALQQQQANYTAGLNQFNAGQSQLMGWASLGVNGALQGASTYGKYFA